MILRIKRVSLIGIVMFPSFFTSHSLGEIEVGGRQQATAFLPIEATVGNVVTLKIEDSLSSGGNLVGSGGINFGSVNTLGTTAESGVQGSTRGDQGHYEAKFSFSLDRSGAGSLTLVCRRSSPGNFNVRDGVEIQDSFGVLRPLPALNPQPVTVLDRVQPGKYEKTIGLNIYPQDKGVLRTVLQFTLSAF